MAEGLEQVTQWYEMCLHDLDIMSWNPCQVELWVSSRPTSVPSPISRIRTKTSFYARKNQEHLNRGRIVRKEML